MSTTILIQQEKEKQIVLKQKILSNPIFSYVLVVLTYLNIQ